MSKSEITVLRKKIAELEERLRAQGDVNTGLINLIDGLREWGDIQNKCVDLMEKMMVANMKDIQRLQD